MTRQVAAPIVMGRSVNAGQPPAATDFALPSPAIPGAQPASSDSRWRHFPRDLDWLAVRKKDALLAGLALAVSLLCLAIAPAMVAGVPVKQLDPLGILCVIGVCAPLAWLRRFPLTAMAIIWAAVAIGRSEAYAMDVADLIYWLALGTAAYFTTVKGRIAMAVLVTIYEVVWWITYIGPETGAGNVFWAMSISLTIMIGTMLRKQRDEAAEQERQVLELERAHAVERERLRIARDLHDIVGHHLSAIGVCARATQTLVYEHPDKAQAELERLAELASEAIDETKYSVAMLRDTPRTAPSPGLDDLDALIASASSHGLSFSLDKLGDVRPLLGSVEMCAYRVIQEAATNCMRHASRPASVHIVLTFEPSVLEVTITSTEVNSVRPCGEQPGWGLIGMRERVEMLGGTFEAGSPTPFEWQVHARLPALSP